MALKFGRSMVSVDIEVSPGHIVITKIESPKPLGKRARRRLRGRIKEEKRNVNA